MRQLAYFLGFGLVLVAIVGIDGQHLSLTIQLALGAATWLAYALVLRNSPDDERREAHLCVLWSTLVELLATQLWHLYGYPLGNVPLYVPPGHGLIFLVSLQAARTAFLERHGRTVARGVLVLAAGWAAWGLAFRHDVHGALYAPFFAWYMLRHPKAPVFAVTIAITTALELYGVRVGTWHWAPEMPGLGLPSGDPPSLIAGGYCSFAEMATLLGAMSVGRRWRLASS